MKRFITFFAVLCLMCPLLLTAQCKEDTGQNENDGSGLVKKKVQLVNLKSINSASLDYSPMPYKDGIIFTSTRGREDKPQSLLSLRKYCDLFYAKQSKVGEFVEPTALTGKINGKFHDGIATFDPSFNIMYFSRNENSTRTDDGIRDLRIYRATNIDGEWHEITEMSSINGKYSTCHPALSKDGNRLYFASNRPGGFGGSDIWVAYNDNGEWTNITNLGPTVNSSGNETFPFISSKEVLYYSSNGHKGLGGLDIFMAIKDINSDEKTWNKRVHMGEKFNSSHDDFGFVILDSGLSGFLTSNRGGGMGGDDVYLWKLKVTDQANLYEDLDSSFFVELDETQRNH